MKLKFEDVKDKLSDEEVQAVYEYATQMANSYLNVYRAGTIWGTTIGVIAALCTAAGASYIAWRILESADEKDYV